MESLMNQLTRGRREDEAFDRNVSDVSDDDNLSAKEIDIYDAVIPAKHATSPTSKAMDASKRRRVQNRKLR